jgi:CO dehydrogenase/acetyl-CoA synthase gamma subunit (corrinoid Fe-S protein)
MRWGFGRTRYSIAPGLYAIGTPSGDSPVLVTANYKMTFDILRRDMYGHECRGQRDFQYRRNCASG